MPNIVSKEELPATVDAEAAISAWLTIDQDRIDLFADATNDHQYIHVDREKAAKTPFGATIAHGFLSLSLLPHLAKDVAVVPENAVMGINYGLNKVRFVQPVKVGSRVRLHSKLLGVTEKKPGHLLLRSEATVEIEGESKPAFVAETLFMYVLSQRAS